jgi:hypothetical protein
MSRASIVAFCLVIAIAAGGVWRLMASQRRHEPATVPLTGPPVVPPGAPPAAPSVTPPAVADDDAALNDADATSLARVWLLYGSTAQKARATATLARLHAAVPATVAPPPIASLSPSAAWEAQAARRRGTEETLDATVQAHAQAIDTLRRIWADEIRAALPAWKPTNADDRLALARLADEAEDRKALVAALTTLSDDTSEAGRVAATWLVSASLESGDVRVAAKALERVRDAFDGQGLDAQGRRVPVSLLAEAVVESGGELARSLVEGPAPDVLRAKESVALAQRVAGDFATDDSEIELPAIARYVSLADAPLDLATTVTGLLPVDGPRVVAFTDDFQLGEPVLASVLRRWSKGIPVTLVGRLTGKARSGIRRVPVTSSNEERALLRAHAKAAGLSVGGFVARDGVEESRLGFATEGASAPGVIVFVLDREHHLVARLSGNSLDPRPLDPVIARLVTDPSVVAPPSEAGPR